ncbi:MAG: 30S ribosomal protein S4 [bacterium]
MPKILEKRERQLGVRLSIKGERGSSPKAALVRRPYPPGQHGKRGKRRPSEFSLQLQEKQKLKFTYSLNEDQIKKVFNKARKQEGAVNQLVAEILESRLDSVVFYLGIAESRSIARHLVSHGHFMVNKRRVNIRSYAVKPGDIITIRSESKDIPLFKSAEERLKNYVVPIWLSLNSETLEGKMESKPRDIENPFDINLVIDYYSR